MTQPILNRPRVVASVGESVAAAMAQHVGVDARQSSARTDALEVAIDGVTR